MTTTAECVRNERPIGPCKECDTWDGLRDGYCTLCFIIESERQKRAIEGASVKAEDLLSQINKLATATNEGESK